ncbi:MAG: M20/M25/M40 family metallo-hydrolase [Bryobacterales bacterium]|nr:M20/M25/M40 family metallo-hydrolase [Bryobacterales bacterium]
MTLSSSRTYFYPLGAALICALAAFAQKPPQALHPTIEKVTSGVSEERVGAVLKKLESFETRDSNGVVAGPGKGIVAAREWIAAEFRSYSPRLAVRFDAHAAKKGTRIVRDTEIVNVVAVLPGRIHPEVHVLVGGHYDTMHMKLKGTALDAEATAAAEYSPGVSDNASGTACVMELARVMSQYEFDKTIVFIAFAGEEQGLLGATGYAKRAKETKETVEALLNVDTIGTNVTGNGIQAGQRVNVYSGDPMDSPSRSLARYMREISERYLPELSINAVFRADRFGRGGDHTPFHAEGFAAVRVTTPAEQLENQHNEKDTLDRVSIPYTTLVTRGVGATLASLALAPRPPVLSTPGRGTSRYDAAMKWKLPEAEPDLAGYLVLLRSTTAPYWEREIFVGQREEYTLKNVSIDEVVLGVRAVDVDGVAGLVSTAAGPGRRVPTAVPATGR